ncbi:cyclic nucleotide-binding and patatin-like phospholipase domain-containing protein [Chondromyces apiculatus]|uniref:Uncharacterized protein n=1 Tax=Chondromyces apiculatus DSM 436 TaxID=1192034 RepID=A0A017SWA2_9BACT|nr:cyclic nucleotide-binding and patatin-like phospholipase domain-containing protein [Chondromyces apiculatus]EYF00551.1 Hypothetical protein CAP_0480 [Chondromyces apiculatus DSM 436]
MSQEHRLDPENLGQPTSSLKPQYIAAFRRSHYLENIRPQEIAELWATAQEIELAPGATVFKQGTAADGFYFLMSGHLQVFLEDQPERVSIASLNAPLVLGDESFFRGAPRTATVVVQGEKSAKLHFWPTQVFKEILATRPSFSRSAPQVQQAFGVSHRAEVVQVESACKADVPLDALTDLLAQGVASIASGLKVLVVHVLAQAAQALASPQIEQGPGALHHLRVAEESLFQHVDAQLPLYDVIFIDAAAVDPRGTRDCTGGRVDTAFILHDTRTDDPEVSGPRSERPSRGAPGRARKPRTIRARLILPNPDPLFSTFRMLKHASATLSGDLASLQHVPIDLGSDVQQHSLRAHVDVAHLRSLWEKSGKRLSLKDLPDLHNRRLPGAPSASAVMAQWARKLMGCQIWLALGGGGSLGFAHVSLIQQMLAANLPIDGISGTSFGSVVGAFYAAMPAMPAGAGPGALPQGLALLLDSLWKLQMGIDASVLSSSALEFTINALLHAPPLEELHIPFRPVTTDIASTRTVVITNATTGFGVRCSSSLSPLFAPVTTPKARYVDGAITDLVPSNATGRDNALGSVVSASQQWGGDVVVASNAVPSAKPEVPSQPIKWLGLLGRLMHDMNPIERAEDALRSGYILLHRTGNLEGRYAAEVLFSLPPTFSRVPFWHMAVADKVMENANTALAQQRIIEKIQAAYKQCLSNRTHA